MVHLKKLDKYIQQTEEYFGLRAVTPKFTAHMFYVDMTDGTQKQFIATAVELERLRRQYDD